MIPAAFEYYRPQDIAGVLAILEEHGDDARVMAGGHSLIPMMKLRMADVPHLIDLQDVGGMSDIEIGADSIRIGAMVSHAKFGVGCVIDQEGNKLEIEFENHGTKRVIDSFVSLVS